MTDHELCPPEMVELPSARLLREQFQRADPFPHVVIDGFLTSQAVHVVVAEFLDPGRMEKQFRDVAEVKSASEDPKRWGPLTRALMRWMNSNDMVGWLEEVTGIEGIIADPTYSGGGLHQIRRGGKLGVHADFNRHPVTMDARRLNLLIYLNEPWHDDWGGHLELWDRSMTRCVKRIAPVAGRAVLFATDEDSFHGHPDPLKCPADVTRKSLALYYYTPAEVGAPLRTTRFRPRPGSDDRVPSNSVVAKVRRRIVRLLARWT